MPPSDLFRVLELVLRAGAADGQAHRQGGRGAAIWNMSGERQKDLAADAHHAPWLPIAAGFLRSSDT